MVRSQEGIEWVIVRLEWNAPYKMAETICDCPAYLDEFRCHNPTAIALSFCYVNNVVAVFSNGVRSQSVDGARSHLLTRRTIAFNLSDARNLLQHQYGSFTR
jgi:hypothetical protein